MKSKILLTIVVIACLTMTALRLRNAFEEMEEGFKHAVKQNHN